MFDFLTNPLFSLGQYQFDLIDLWLASVPAVFVLIASTHYLPAEDSDPRTWDRDTMSIAMALTTAFLWPLFLYLFLATRLVIAPIYKQHQKYKAKRKQANDTRSDERN